MERSFIEYKDKRYPTIVIQANKIDPEFKDAPDIATVTIADYELWKAIEDGYYKGNSLETEIDNTIHYYCDSGFVASKPTEGEVVHYFKGITL